MSEDTSPSTSVTHTVSDVLGPVDVLVVAFADGVPHPEGFDQLLGLAKREVIRILDVEFIAKDPELRIIAAESLTSVDFDGAMWAGASSGLLDDDDLDVVGADLATGELAAVVLIEERWLLGVVAAWPESDVRLISDGGIPTADLIAALDAAELRRDG